MSKVKNILDKLRPDHNDIKQAKSIERIAAIGHTSDAIGWRPVPYEIPVTYQNFLANLDTEIDAFISKANPDRYNAGYFEEVIEAECKLALEETGLQEIEHGRSNHNIDIYQQACLTNLELHLQRMEEALNKKKEAV